MHNNEYSPLTFSPLCPHCACAHAHLGPAVFYREQKLGLTAQALKGLSRKSKSSRRKVAQQATDELFDSAVQEVVDETNLPRSALGKPLLSGLVRQGNSFGAPSAGEHESGAVDATFSLLESGAVGVGIGHDSGAVGVGCTF